MSILRPVIQPRPPHACHRGRRRAASEPGSRRRKTGGFSLVEVMVGLVIGMIGMVVMLQVFSVSEGNKRSTTGGDDAQNNGTIALYDLQSDIRQSGNGNSSTALLGCNVLLRSGVTLNAMAPVTINHASIPAGDANTDTILTVSGNTVDSPEGDTIVKNTVQNKYEVTIPSSFKSGDYVIATPSARSSPCNLTLEVAQSVDTTVNVTTGVAGVGSGTLFNMGNNSDRKPRIEAYAVRGGNLTVCDFMTDDCSQTPAPAAIWIPIVANIVSLRAEYGVDTSSAMDGIVDAYTQTPTLSSACNWARVSAVRLALVARSGQYNKNTATAAAPSWAGATSTPALPIDLSGDANWQHYRYKTFRLTVPIRNIAMQTVPTSC